MKVLVIGNGGREHALVWKLAQSPSVTKLYCAPGNAGTAEQAENIPINANDVPALVTFAREQGIDIARILSVALVDLGARLALQTRQLLGVARCQRHRHALLREKPRDRGAEARSRADDEGDFLGCHCPLLPLVPAFAGQRQYRSSRSLP